MLETQSNDLQVHNTSGGEGLRNTFGVLFLLISLLLPLAFFPGVVVLSFVAKLAVITTLVAVSIIVLLLSVLGSGNIEFPRSRIVLSLFLIPVATVISSFVSGNVLNSLVGGVFEIGTAGSFIILFILFVLAVAAGYSTSMLKRVLQVSLMALGLSLLYSIVYAILRKSGLALTNMPQTLMGSLIDSSILLSAGSILSIYIMNLSDSGRKTKILIWIFLILSSLFIGSVGWKPIFVLLGIFSIIMFVYSMATERNQGSHWIKRSYPTLFILLVSIIFVISGTSLSNFLSNTFGVNSLDVRPNLSSTLSVVREQWTHNPVTGFGPNKFFELWALYKPQDINESPFWATDFYFGSGLIPTLAATTGALGLLAVLLFLGLFVKNGFKIFFAQVEDAESKALGIAVFMSALFLWASAFIYNLGLSVLAFTFILTGLFVASLVNTGVVRSMRINVFSNPKANFVSVFLVVALIIGTISGGYFVWEKIVASVMFNKAVLALNSDGNVEKAGIRIAKAASIYRNDGYLRALAELNLLNVENIANSIPANSTSIPENVRSSLQSSVGSAVQAADAAIKANPDNYQNYFTLARVYESLAQKGIQGALESANNYYSKTEELNPMNPDIQLAYARLSVLANKVEEAKEKLNRAIELKKNYSNSYFMLAQLEAATNNTQGAIRAVESATLIDPLNAGLYFQLGLLKYQILDYSGATLAFERAVAIVPNYANAQYFLGLSYHRLNKKEDALAQFKAVATTNPDNEEVKLIISNLEAGKDPFTGAKPPIDAKPEKRQTPPIDEANSN